MKRWSPTLLAAALVATAVVSWFHASLYHDQGSSLAPAEFTVEDGASLARVAEDLESAGLLEESWRLRLVARIEGGAREIRAGDYAVPRGASPATILRLLVSGRVLTVPVTLVEGWTARQTVAALAEALNLDPGDLQELVDAPPAAMRQRLGIPAGHGLEGYLFPETYHFARRISAERVVREIVGGLEASLVDSVRTRIGESGRTLHEVLTLASIVEAEAVRDDERTSIAAVYHNRIAKGWKLEADPTVAYALEKQGKRLVYRDLEVDSPYNTYRNAGLPPGPINSPGIASILATLWPREDFDAMYFVADGTGGHRFSRTWEEHSAAVREYRKIQRQRRENASG